MSDNQEVFKKLPGVFAFKKLMLISDGVFSSIVNNEEKPLPVMRIGARGVLGTLSKKDAVNLSNMQVGEAAKTDSNAEGFSVTFSIKTLPLTEALHSCSGEGSEKMREAINRFLEKALDTNINDGLKELSLRYARNILNGRWLWRNLLLADSVSIEAYSGNNLIAKELDALSISKEDFNGFTNSEKALSEKLLEGFLGASSSITVKAKVLFGFQGSVEVYPSQSYVSPKLPKGFSKLLYKVDVKPVSFYDEKTTDFSKIQSNEIVGRAALRDQKIGNAIRTVDTWHQNGVKPIPVEQYGANLEDQVFYRPFKEKNSAFDLLRKINQLSPTTLDGGNGAYLLASIIRGGVFSESDD